MLGIVRSSWLGALRSLSTELRDTRPFDARSILHDPSAGGGVLLHAGCYPVHWMRALTDAEPEVIAASAEPNPLGADETITAELAFPRGVAGRLHASFAPGERQGNRLTIVGERGELRVENLIAPHAGHSVVLHVDGEAPRTFTVAGATSYDHQLAALVDALETGIPLPAEGADIVANAAAIEAIRDAAGIGAQHG